MDNLGRQRQLILVLIRGRAPTLHEGCFSDPLTPHLGNAIRSVQHIAIFYATTRLINVILPFPEPGYPARGLNSFNLVSVKWSFEIHKWCNSMSSLFVIQFSKVAQFYYMQTIWNNEDHFRKYKR